MSISNQRTRVAVAERRMQRARAGVAVPAAALRCRGERHPLTVLGLAAALGAVLGRLDIQPLRVPGVSLLFGGGMAEIAALGARLIAGLGASMGPDSTQP